MVVGELNVDTDVVVIGGGPGGYVAAIRAAELGLATVLVERAERPGGLCLHHGCIPSKALLAAADLAYRARNAAAMGLRVPEVAVDMQALRAWQQGLVDRLARGVATLLDKHGVTVVRGAVELAVALRKLGSAVTLVGAGRHLLPEVDAALVPLAERGLRRLGVQWRREAQPTELTEAGLRVARGDAQDEDVPAELVIVSAAERVPNVDELGLDLVRMRQHDEGFVMVDERQQTSVAGVYAVGDVTPGAAWAHRAYRQGKVAAEVIAGRPTAFDPRSVPALVLGAPELASVGLGVEEARTLGYDPVVSRFPWAASGRALTLGAEDGQTLVVSDRASGVALGVHIAGAGAGELIGEAALALEMGATLEDVALTIHPHPTRSEGIVEAGELALGLPTHVLPA